MNLTCRACGGTLSKVLFKLENMPSAAQYFPKKKDLEHDTGISLCIRECSRCGLIQHDSMPVPYYREVIRASAYSEEMKKFRLAQFSEWLERYGLKGKKVFEAGCGRGEYLELMRESGARVSGIEYGNESVKICGEKGLDVQKLFFEHPEDQLEGGRADGFFVLNFLEHIPDLRSFLRGIYSNVKDRAPGLIEVPDFDMISKCSLLTEFSAEHLCYFSKKTLCRLLETNGFEVVKCNSIWSGYILSAEVIRRSEADFSGFAVMKRKLETEMHAFLAEYSSVWVWGAGHQSMTLLAMLGVSSGNVEKILDSSPLKYGRYTFSTHIPIENPEILEREKPEALIIACAGYSDEVVRLIRTRYGASIKLAVMRNTGLEIL